MPKTDDKIVPEAAIELMRQDRPRIGREEISRAVEILSEYKAGKANLERRIVEDELWWELRHWEAIRGKDKSQPNPTSAWLFNAILGKHADAMDNYPAPVVLPRERSDEDSARMLSSVLPVVLEYNNFEDAYDYNWWEFLKHGTAPYGVFWDAERENGLGDIAIAPIDLLNIFWEPGVTDIQDSRNLFITQLVDEQVLDEQYPEHRGKMGGSVIDIAQYVYDDTVDTSDKAVVVDWYYKTRNAAGRKVLQYVKFVGDTLLFASENDERYRETGWYEHGEYPVVFDTLFPEKGTPVGFGYVAICKDPQLYIDKLFGNILESAMMGTKKRFFISSNTGVNEEEFLDWSRPFVHVEGELDDRRLQEIVTNPIPSIYVDVAQLKIEEMKDTAANRDVNAGSAGGGVTAASAIAALQEAGNKVSRDMIKGSYRAYSKICSLCIELMRQFYTETRAFRVTQPNGMYEFVDMSNARIREQPMGLASTGEMLYRKPVFDLKVKAQKTSPFSRMEQNERAKELYGLGFFNPERAQEAMGALEMMDFEGIDKVRETVQQGQTLLSLCNQLSQQVAQLTAMMGMAVPAAQPAQQTAAPSSGSSIDRSAAQAQTPRMSYADRLAQRSVPDMDSGSNAATPQ